MPDAIFEPLVRAARLRNLNFLVIGGYAVAAHGYPRTTYDIDIVVCHDEIEAWRETVIQLGYREIHHDKTFVQFNHPTDALLNLDIMHVSRDTFDKMQSEKRDLASANEKIGVVSLKHLVALKCHAVRHGSPSRNIKDLTDLIHLIDNNKLDITGPEWRDLIRSHGGDDTYEKLRPKQ